MHASSHLANYIVHQAVPIVPTQSVLSCSLTAQTSRCGCLARFCGALRHVVYDINLYASSCEGWAPVCMPDALSTVATHKRRLGLAPKGCELNLHSRSFGFWGPGKSCDGPDVTCPAPCANLHSRNAYKAPLLRAPANIAQAGRGGEGGGGSSVATFWEDFFLALSAPPDIRRPQSPRHRLRMHTREASGPPFPPTTAFIGPPAVQHRVGAGPHANH